MAECYCAGDLRERVTITLPIDGRDSVGGLVRSWSPLATVWARVKPMSEREQWHREQIQSTAQWAITIRYRDDVTTKQRVSWRGRRFEVVGVQNADERRRFLRLACDELFVDEAA